MGREQRDRVAVGRQAVHVRHQGSFAQIASQALARAKTVVLGSGGLKFDDVFPALFGTVGIVIQYVVVPRFAHHRVDQSTYRQLVRQRIQAAKQPAKFGQGASSAGSERVVERGVHRLSGICVGGQEARHFA